MQAQDPVPQPQYNNPGSQQQQAYGQAPQQALQHGYPHNHQLLLLTLQLGSSIVILVLTLQSLELIASSICTSDPCSSTPPTLCTLQRCLVENKFDAFGDVRDDLESSESSNSFSVLRCLVRRGLIDKSLC